MMKNIIRSPYRKLKILLVLPVIAIVLYSFAKPEYQYEVIEALPNVIKILETDQDPVTKPVAPQQVEKKVKMGKSDPGAPPPPPPPVKKSDVSSPPPPPPPPPVKASEVDSPPASLLKIRSEGGIPPLFIVNGKEMSESAIEKIDPETINTISVLKDQAATAVFGERGKDGVIMVTTKDVISTVSGEDIMNKDPSADKIEVGGYGNERSSNIILRDYKGGSSSNPLIILDGKVYGNSLERISPNDIQSISVHKDKETIKLYGGKGNDGVIIITSKKK